MSVRVAVRVRPFNDRETELGSNCCIRMEGDTTMLIDENGKERTFNYDFSLWSHDGFEMQDNGYAKPTDDQYCDQQKIFELIGQEVLNNAWDGYHCCLFAYGQTGSGKSYSIFGYGTNKGIVPLASMEIFSRINKNDDPNKAFEVSVSMVEIYNEKVQDQLVEIHDRPRAGLKIRESTTIGVYVEGLSKAAVASYAEIEKVMEKGDKHRSIASTLMNKSSSRAHTIIKIEFVQKIQDDTQNMTRLSNINLVDLAGSEKVGKTGATGDRQKEASSINKSLSNLGIVISDLADKAAGKGKGKIVPYRDSSLTRILQNALGGNSKTIMICAQSPSSDNYEETLSTLRYADQAKKIKNCATVNESATDKIIRELKEENDKMKDLFMYLKKHGALPPGYNFEALDNQLGIEEQNNDTNTLQIVPENVNPNSPRNHEDQELLEEAEQAIKDKENLEKKLEETKKKDEQNKEIFNLRIKELEEKVAANANLEAEYEKTFEQKYQEMNMEFDEDEDEKKVDYTRVAHLCNVNEDPMLSGKILIDLETRDRIVVGKKSDDFIPDIMVGQVPGIKPMHAVIQVEEDGIFIFPCDEECSDTIFMNGDNVKERTQLFHLDRLVFGINSFFLFKDPLNFNDRRDLIDEKEIDYLYFQNETQSNNYYEDINNQVNKEIIQVKLAEVEEKNKKEKDVFIQKMNNLQEEHQSKIRDVEEKIKNMEEEKIIDMERIQAEREFVEAMTIIEKEKMKKDIELEKQRKDIMNMENLQKIKEDEKKYLEGKLAKYLTRITEVNLIAKELKRNISFSPYLTYQFTDSQLLDKHNSDKQKQKIKVLVENHEEGYNYVWELSRFSNRYFIIKDLLERYFENNEVPKLEKEKDPFFDPMEPQLIGQGFLKLMSLAYLLDNPTELILVGDAGESGTLNVALIPCSEDGEELDPDCMSDDDIPEDPRDLIGKPLYFAIKIDGAVLPLSCCNDVFARYNLLQTDGSRCEYNTKKMMGKHEKPTFKYTKLHNYNPVNESVLSYLLNYNLAIEVYGCHDKKPPQLFKDAPRKDTNTDINELNKARNMINEKEMQRKSLNSNSKVPQMSKNNQPKGISLREAAQQKTLPNEQRVYTPPPPMMKSSPNKNSQQAQNFNAHQSQHQSSRHSDDHKSSKRSGKKQESEKCQIF